MWESLYAITKILTAVITGVLGPILLWWVKETYSDEDDNPNEEKTITEKAKFDENISKKLESIRQEIGCDRVWIAQFHNGGKLLNSGASSSMKKISIIYEVTDKGISKEKSKIDNVLVSFFSKLISKISNLDQIFYDIKNQKIDPEVKLLLRERGTNQMNIFAMKNIDGSLIGIMGVDFIRDHKKLNQEEIQYLKVKANLLAGYIVQGETV